MNHLVKPSSDKEELQRATSHGGDGASGTCCHGGDRGLGGGGEWQRNSGQCSTPSSLCVSAVGTGGAQGEGVTGNGQALVVSLTE